MAGHDGEGEGFVEVGVNEFASLGDGFRFAAVLHGGEVVGVAAELFAEAGEEGDHALVTFGIDRLGLEVGGLEGIDVVGDDVVFAEGDEDALEVTLFRGALEDLAGFEEGDGAGAEFDGDGSGGHAGEASAGDGALDFGLVHEAAVGGDAGLAGGVAEVQFFAEGALIVEVLGEAPLFIDRDEPEGEAGGVAKGVLVGAVEIGLGKPFEDPVLVVLQCGLVSHGIEGL